MAQENNNLPNLLAGLFNKEWLTARDKFDLIFKDINGIKLYLGNLNGYLMMGFPVQEIFELFQIQNENNLTLSKLILKNAAQDSSLIALYLELLRNFLTNGLPVPVIGNLLKEEAISYDKVSLSLGYLMLKMQDMVFVDKMFLSSNITNYLRLISQLFEKGFSANEIFNILNIQTENGLHLGRIIFEQTYQAGIDLYLTLLRRLLEVGIPAKSVIKLLNLKNFNNKILSDYSKGTKYIVSYLKLVKQLLKEKDIFPETLTFMGIDSNNRSIVELVIFAYSEARNIQAGIMFLSELLELGVPAKVIFNNLYKGDFNSICINYACEMKINNEYFSLLENLIKYGIPVENISSIICAVIKYYPKQVIKLTLDDFLIYQISVHNNTLGQGIINYLIFVTHLCEKYKLSANKIKQTIAAKYKEFNFIKHLTEKMTKAKYDLSIQANILYYLLNNGFIPESEYTSAARYKDHILAYILAFEEDKKLQTLLNALNPKHPLGKLFWAPRGLAKPDLKSGTLKKILSELNAMGYEYEETTNTDDFPLFSIKGAKGILFSLTDTPQASTSLTSVSMLKPDLS